MVIDPKKDRIVFESTGRSEYAYSGVIGLQPGTRNLTYGFDGEISCDYTKDLAPSERQELALYMIIQWIEFAK